MKADRLRSQHDREMFEQLVVDPDIKKVNEKIAKREEKGQMGVRRHLLSTAVRLSKTMAADLHQTANECAETLGLDIPFELYAFPSPSFNAACVKPEAGRLFIMFSSSLLEAFADTELKFAQKRTGSPDAASAASSETTARNLRTSGSVCA